MAKRWMSELLNELAHLTKCRNTGNYRLIRDSMRGDTPEVLHFDISSRVMAAIEEPVRQPAVFIDPEAQAPAPHQWQKMPFWQKVRPWGGTTPNGRSSMPYRAVIVGVSTIMDNLKRPAAQKRRYLIRR